MNKIRYDYERMQSFSPLLPVRLSGRKIFPYLEEDASLRSSFIRYTKASTSATT